MVQPRRTRIVTVHPVTRDFVDKAARWRLQRRPMSVARLRRALEQRVRRAAPAQRPPEVSAWIDDVVARCLREGLLDDARLAIKRAKAWRGRGLSRGMIMRRLRVNGIDDDVAARALKTVDALPDAELAAARVTLARRGVRESKRGLAVLARRGFAADVAARAVA